jgi:hypothetical protein
VVAAVEMVSWPVTVFVAKNGGGVRVAGVRVALAPAGRPLIAPRPTNVGQTWKVDTRL